MVGFAIPAGFLQGRLGLTQLLEIALPVPLGQDFSYRCREDTLAPGETAATPGDLALVPFGRRKQVVGLVLRCQPLGEDTLQVQGHTLRDVLRIFPREYRVQDDRWRLLHWLAHYYALPLGEVLPLFHPPAPGTRSRSRPDPLPGEDYPQIDKLNLLLTCAQKEAVDLAGRHLAAGTFGSILLHGVTGSGKTEVYLRVIEDVLAAGRDAIFLLPEIALTPQTLTRITARFGQQAAAIHSGLSAGQRCAVHERAARGEIKVVVGPRSALFAPLRNLGVIIVDEEHDASYKQDEKPRYHARHAALVRGRENQAVVVLGSATPDLESMHNTGSGRFALMRLSDRLGGTLPPVEIVDMRGERSLDGFSPALNEALAEVLAQEKQAILFYNRRGFARIWQCISCGEVAECNNCDIGLTFHLRPRRLLCHYCGHSRSVPDHCPVCGAEEFLPSGGGTEKVELNLLARFPGARILRLDHDSTRRRGSHQRILTAFARRKADILVGTQMVAKGHHFPGVALVGVLAADDGLGMPDYRAAERSFQLLTQVAGRAGRTEAGRVFFQTYRPEDPVIQAAAGHDYETFLAGEMPLRQQLGYPPYLRLMRLGISGRRLGLVQQAADGLAAAVRQQLQDQDLVVLGPAPAVFPRLQGRYRFQILLKGSLDGRQKAWLANCLASLKKTFRGIEVLHDVDPVSVY